MNLLFQIMPALMNITTGLYFFISAKRMAESGASSLLVALTMVVWAVCYAGTSGILGRFLTRQNASTLVFTSEVIILLSLAGLLTFPDARLQYYWLPGTGIGAGMFFTSFQIVVKLLGKNESRQGSVAKTAAIYTFSWSFGLAIGPLIAALVWGLFSPESGWKYCYWILIVMDLFMMAATLCMRSFVKKRLAEPEGAEAENKNVFSSEKQKMPDIMSAAWTLQFFGYTVIAMMRTYLPDYCTKILHMSTFNQASVMALISFVQAFAALCCCKAVRWPYKPWGVGSVCIGGVAAMLIFFSCAMVPAYVFAAALLGIFSGVYCFITAFHALANQEKTPQYVSVNETLVGVTSMYAPLAGGFLADLCGVKTPFLLGALFLCVAMIFYAIYTWRYRKI